MNPMERGNRFSDWTPIQTQGQPVFAGPDAIIARLNDLRTHINNIRTEWHNKDKFKKSLQTRILYDLNLTEEEERLQLRSEIDALFARDLTWIDAGYKYSGSEETDFCGITLYTSSSGYDCVFGHFNKLLRGEEVQNDPELARDTVFLVELLTIELYNFRFANWGNPMIYDFEGIVYRGMSLPEESFRYLQEVANRPANQRTISVPLSFLSATSDKTVAEQFFVGDKAQNERCIQWIIHVRSLAPDLAESFNKQYPESIVTSLCAIPIARLSKFWQEKEVLLRGPFFQVLRMYEDEGLDAAGNSFRFHKLEVVMLNSNRDHQTAEASDIGQDKEMRQHFRKAVEVSRNAICAELAEEQGLHDDAAYFRRVATEGRVELGLSRDSPPASSPGSKPTAWGTEWSAGHASHFFARPYRERRAAYAAIISEQNWGELFKVIDEEYEWQKGDWVNYVDLAEGDTQGMRGWAVLHTMAHHGAPISVVERLIELGAWRSLRTMDTNRTALDLALESGHSHLVELLQPVVKHAIGKNKLQRLERKFHELLEQKVGVDQLRQLQFGLPQLTVLTELETPQMWYMLPGTYRGVSFELTEQESLQVSFLKFQSASDIQSVLITP